MNKKWTPHIIAVGAFVVFIVLGLACASAPVNISKPEDFVYKVIETGGQKSVTITGVKTKENITKLTIPETIEGFPVTAIGDEAFRKQTSLENVKLPKSLTVIGNSAFKDCSWLKSVNFPDSLSFIGEEAFSDCKYWLKSVNFPNSLTSIGNKAFYGCSGLENINFSEGLTIIGNSTFEYCYKLTAITFPESLTTIGDKAFYKCSGLISVQFSEGLITIGQEAFGCDGILTTGKLTSISLPTSLTTIGSGAFALNKLTTVHIPKGVTSMGGNPFNNNPLSEITIAPDNSVYIIKNDFLLSKDGKTVFCYFGSKECIIPNGITIIGNSAFQNQKLNNIILPSSLVSIGSNAFSRNYLTHITIPDSVTTIGYSAFSENKLVSVSLPASINSIETGAFPFILNEVYAWSGRKKGNYTWVNGSWYVDSKPLFTPAVLQSASGSTRESFTSANATSSVTVSKIDGKPVIMTDGKVYLMPGTYDVTAAYNIYYRGYEQAQILQNRSPRFEGERRVGKVTLNEGSVYTFGCSSTLNESPLSLSSLDIWLIKVR